MEKDINVEEYANRLAYELSVIEQKGLAGYFLIVQDLVNWAKSQDILVGPGRGSAAGSLISYTLGITAIDPIEHGLLFQRFLNPERKSLPDIDLDIMDIARGDIINYLSKKYGQDNVCQIITFGTLQSKMALKDAGRILGIKFEVVNNITSKILSIDGRPYSIQQSIDLIPDVAQASQEYPELFELAMHLEGIPRHSGIHAAGVVITPDELVKYIPLARGKNEEAIAQFEKNTLEDLGLLKLDILALKTLTTMYYALQSIRELHGVKINLNKIPLDDPATLRLIASGNTIGVFQLESEGMQRIFKELNNVTFKALVAGISLYRPGPLSLIPTYISGYNGLRHVDYLVPQLEPILKDTYGVILYQEQTMKIATDLAGYTPGQSDSLRKAIGKKLPEVMKQEMHKLVYGSSEEGIPGMIANGISEDNAIKIAELIERFAGYGFNLSHATGYAVLAFQTAYLKAHYPLEFMCAQLSVAGNKDKVTKYAQEAIRMGIKILPPSINKSGVNFLIENGNIRFALSSINGVGEKIAQRIIENAPYENIEYLLDALPKRTLNKKVLRALALSGALDELDPYNCRMQLYQRLLTLREDKEDISDKVKEFNTRSKLQYEYDLTGLYISDHPLRRVAKPVAWEVIPEKKSISNYILISNLKVTTTKKGLDMCVLTAETLEGSKTFFVFTKAYNQYKSEIIEGAIVKITFTKEPLGLVIHNVKLSKRHN
jgi:DNA polymerase-3 subunit alpha